MDAEESDLFGFDVDDMVDVGGWGALADAAFAASTTAQPTESASSSSGPPEPNVALEGPRPRLAPAAANVARAPRALAVPAAPPRAAAGRPTFLARLTQEALAAGVPQPGPQVVVVGRAAHAREVQRKRRLDCAGNAGPDGRRPEPPEILESTMKRIKLNKFTTFVLNPLAQQWEGFMSCATHQPQNIDAHTVALAQEFCSSDSKPRILTDTALAARLSIKRRSIPERVNRLASATILADRHEISRSADIGTLGPCTLHTFC